MEIKQLLSLIAIADHGSFSAAAKALDTVALLTPAMRAKSAICTRAAALGAAELAMRQLLQSSGVGGLVHQLIPRERCR